MLVLTVMCTMGLLVTASKAPLSRMQTTHVQFLQLQARCFIVAALSSDGYRGQTVRHCSEMLLSTRSSADSSCCRSGTPAKAAFDLAAAHLQVSLAAVESALCAMCKQIICFQGTNCTALPCSFVTDKQEQNLLCSLVLRQLHS
jgi:hypothetical protein